MKTYLYAGIALVAGAVQAFAQQADPSPVPSLSAQEQQEVLTQLIHTIDERYVFPDIAKKIELHLRKQQTAGVFQSLTNPEDFAITLTGELQKISHDKHLRVRYSRKVIPPEPEQDLMRIPEHAKEAYRLSLQHSNFGINKVDVLNGNIGYLSVNFFCSPEFAGDTYAAAMNYLAHTDALILDLRKCRGSASPDAIPFLCSYFFATPVHLNDLKWRKDNRLTQSWTYAYVPGKKYLDKPIYVLTSGATFSGAEEIAYDLQVLKRATVVGQVTAGGANPGGTLRLTDHFSAFIPIGQAINPITLTNWEGTGVKPDTLLNAAKALTKAHELALEHSLKTTPDKTWASTLKDVLRELKANQKPVREVFFELNGFPNAKEVFVTGSFNEWTPKANPMQLMNDKWILKTEAEVGKLSYQFIVDGKPVLDPANTQTETNGSVKKSVKIID